MRSTYHKIEASCGDLIIRATVDTGGNLEGKISVLYYGEDESQLLELEKKINLGDLERAIQKFHGELAIL